ncbi:MAG: hypothetical protein ACYTBX_14685 [Planctomycetota bacterium]
MNTDFLAKDAVLSVVEGGHTCACVTLVFTGAGREHQEYKEDSIKDPKEKRKKAASIILTAL